MWRPYTFSRGISLLIGVGLAAILCCMNAPPADAANPQTSSVISSPGRWTVETRRAARAADKRYFIEFRSRPDAVYGHLYVLYGEVNSNNEIVKSRIAGLHPTGDSKTCENCSLFNLTIGHVIFVPAETGASDGDRNEKNVTARYRVWMDWAHYKDLDAYIRKLQRDSPVWNVLVQNCVEFGRSIATHMGLHVPLLVLMEPEAFVTDLRELNGMTKHQHPLRYAANSLRDTTVHSVSNPPLPPQRPKLQPVSYAHPAASMITPAGQTVASSATR
jgi:hypothetical protein